MNILEINFSDLVGHIFNGYDLANALIKKGINANQIVIDKRSDSGIVTNIDIDPIVHLQLFDIEKKYSINNLLFPYAKEIVESDVYKNADLIHCHILHNGVASLFDYPLIMNNKPTVWTVHDPWIVTGHCIYPLDCPKWETGCGKCFRYNEGYMPMESDNTEFMWNVKKSVLGEINPHIVVSTDFMMNYLTQSPITRHFSDISKIPFGIDISLYDISVKFGEKNKKDKIAIGFRVEENPIKGISYLFDALRELDISSKVRLKCVGAGEIPEDIKKKYEVEELKWLDEEAKMIEFFSACDIFVMPSLAETFGLMAIESMAAGCTFLCFKDTVLEEVSYAPEIGIAVEYKSKDALSKELKRLVENPDEIIIRGEKGHDYVKKHFRFDDYVDSHIALYERVFNTC